MPTRPSLWLQDFSTLPPGERRLARYALQLLRSMPTLKQRHGLPRLKRPLVHRGDAAEYLLPLIAPLLDREVMAIRSPLRRLGLIDVCDRDCDLEDHVRPSALLQEVLNNAPAAPNCDVPSRFSN